MSTAITAVGNTTSDDNTLEHIRQAVGDGVEITTMPRGQELPPVSDAVDDLDPDMITLREALAAVDKPKSDEPEPEPAPEPQQPVEVPDATATPPASDDPSVMIPKARLDEALRKKESAENQANYWKGIADATKQMATTVPANSSAPAAPAEQLPTFDEVFTDLNRQKVDLAKTYDTGELTAEQWAEKQAQIDAQIRVVANQQATQQLQAVQEQALVTARQEVQKAELDRQAVQLEQAHPYTKLIKNEEDWAWLNKKATKELLTQYSADQLTNTLQGKLAFRQHLAQLCDQYGPALTGQQPSAPAASPGSPTPPATVTQPSNQPDAAQRQSKIDLSKQQPPMTTTMGTQGGQMEISATDIDKMSEEDIGALPESVRSRLRAA